MLNDAAHGHQRLEAVPAVELGPLKSRQRATWASGDYAAVGTTLQLVGELLCEQADLRAGWRVLDVAAGNGNASLAAARRGCEVTAADYVPELLARAGERARAERLDLVLREADAEALPFPDGAFDAVLSTFGVMFAPDQERAAAELLRACRPGGRIGLASWTPDGFVGQLLAAIGRRVPPPPGLRSPALWGTRERLQELLGAGARGLELAERSLVFRYRSPADWLGAFRARYGPMLKAFAALEPAGQAALEEELLALAARFNRSGDAAAVIPATYLECVAVRS